MTTRTLPDVEDAVIQYLLGTVVADMVEDRIYAATPEDVAYPHLTVRLVSPAERAHHWLGVPLLQIDGWASRANAEPRALARDICEAAVAVLHDAANFQVGDAVLGACTVALGPRPLPNPPTDNPRFSADVRIPYHRAREAS